MLERASWMGSATLWRRSICAAWCETNSIFSSRRSGSRSASAMSAWTKRAPAGTFSRRPAERSSTTTTRWPSATWRPAMCDPMKPAPPVTRMFIESPLRMIAKAAPDPRLRIDPDRLGLAPPSRAFFRRSTVPVARDLDRRLDRPPLARAWYGARIVETEAYLGAKDRAAHSWNGRRTARVEPMYADGGHLYVYFVYGMHHCANVVTRRAGVPEAVLLRAAEGPEGAPRLLSGPGRLCRALGITTSMTGLDLLSGGPVAVLRRPRARRPPLAVSARIGVDYAGEAAKWPLRFFDAASAAVSVRQRR